MRKKSLKMTLNPTNNINKTIRYLTYLLIVLWIFFYVVRFYNGEEKGYIRILDCADHELVFVKQLLRSGALIPTSIEELEKEIPEAMEGIPRYYHRTGLNFTFLFFSIFPTYYAYMVEDFVVHLIGIVAMFVFLRNYVIPENKEVSFLVAIIFGFLNYQHIQYGITVAGMPLMFNAFFNILYKKDKWFDYVFIFLVYPFFSFFHAVVLYMGLVLGFVGIYYWRQKKQPFPFKYFIILVLYGTVSLLLEYPILYGMLWGEPSHRQEMETRPLPFIDLIKIMIMGSDLFGVAHFSFILFILFILFMVSFKQKKHVLIVERVMPWIVLLTTIFLFIILYQNSLLRKLDKFNLRKVIVLLPIAYFSILAIALDFIIKYQPKIKSFIQVFIIGLLMIFISTVLWKNHEIRGNMYNFLSLKSPYPSFQELYLPALWKKLKKEILSSEKNRIVCIGYHSNIAQYFGLYTADSYRNNYPLYYKYKFRKVIEKELSKNQKLQELFDNWGNFCTITPAEYPDLFYYYVNKPRILSLRHNSIKKLEINTVFLRDSLNCHWIISTMPILNASELNISLKKVYHYKFFDFRIYKIL